MVLTSRCGIEQCSCESSGLLPDGMVKLFGAFAGVKPPGVTVLPGVKPPGVINHISGCFYYGSTLADLK